MHTSRIFFFLIEENRLGRGTHFSLVLFQGWHWFKWPAGFRGICLNCALIDGIFSIFVWLVWIKMQNLV
jgi:hypothetical protein